MIRLICSGCLGAGAGAARGISGEPTSGARTAAEVVFLASQGREHFQGAMDWQFADAAEVAALGPFGIALI